MNSLICFPFFYLLALQEAGHLSYKCPNNLLGEREPPPKKKKLKKGQKNTDGDEGEGYVLSFTCLF